MSMYPKDEVLDIDGEKILFPCLENGKFTNGDFNNPEKLASFIPAETVNLILDNLESVVKSAGLEANNFEQDQLLKAIRKEAIEAAHPVGSYYSQYTNENGNFVDAYSPSKMFGGVWQLVDSDKGTFYRTEGGNSMDRGRNANGVQGDAIRNVSGHIVYNDDLGGTSALTGGGVFYNGGAALTMNTRITQSGSRAASVYIDLSRQVPTGLENRPINRLIRIWHRIA